MRCFIPDTNDTAGNVPTGMENDPRADEEVINQDAGETYPEPTKEAKLAPDKLADSIAYALDGSGPGPMNEKPNVSGHDVVTEGTTGAGPEEEESLFDGK